MNYNDWLAYRSSLAKRDVSQDNENYDLEGYFNNANSTPIDPDYDKTKEAGKPYNGHLPDTFKKPNHPTFSDQSMYHVPVVQQGGNWEGSQKEGFKFTPSKHNIENMGRSNLQSYFNDVESPEALNLPSDELKSKARVQALTKMRGR